MTRQSLQRVDPIGALAGSALTAAAGMGVVVLAVGGAVVCVPLAAHPAAVVLAAGISVASAALLVVAVARRQGPVRRRTALAVVLLGVTALLVAVVGIGDAQVPGMVWAGYPTSLLILALVPYRPAAEVVAITLGVVLVAVLAVTVVSPDGAFGLAGYRQIAMLLSIAALPLGGVAFAAHVLGFLERSGERLLASATSEAREQETAIIRTVQQTRVSVLNREILPFFAEIAATGRIEAGDRDRAHEMAEAIRSIMVADIDRSWLAQFFAERGAVGRPGAAYRVDDPDLRAQLMDLDQRAALRALVGRLELAAGDSPVDCTLDIVDRLGGVHLLLVAHLGVRRREAHRVLAPYLAVIGAVFADVRFVIRADTLTLRFSL